MAEEYKSIKIKEDVKNRLDRYKKEMQLFRLPG